MSRKQAPEFVAPWVRRALGAARMARLAEAAAVAAGACLSLGAICVLQATSGTARLASLVIGSLAAGLTWWLAYRPEPGAIARRIDASLDLGGGFLTAYQAQLQSSAPSEGLLGLLARRTLAGLRWRDVRRAALPHSLACAAAPFAGAAILAGALQVARERAERPEWTRVVAEDLLAELSLAHKKAFGSVTLDDAAVEGMAGLLDQAREALDGAGLMDAASAGQDELAGEGLLELQKGLEEVATAAQADPELDAHLDQAAADLEALLARPEFQDQAGAEAVAKAGRAKDGEASKQSSAAAENETVPGSRGQDAEPADSGRRESFQDLLASHSSSGAAQAGKSPGVPGSQPPQQWPLGETGAAPRALPETRVKPEAALDWMFSLPPHRRSLAQRWLERRSTER